MNSLAFFIQNFLSIHLQSQRQASPHTIASYRDTFRLLLTFAQKRVKKQPVDMLLTDIDRTLIMDFLKSLTDKRANTERTVNARLAAIHSFFRYISLQEPEYLFHAQRILAIPAKRCTKKVISFLTQGEIETLLASPDRRTHLGRRDFTLMLLLVQTGLRIGEALNLKAKDIQLGSGPNIKCLGKGRKDRLTPLTAQTVAALRQWLKETQPQPEQYLFESRRGTRLSHDAASRLVTKHVKSAQCNCPSLKDKKVTPHVFRHTTAVQLLRSGIDISVIALWLGHESLESTQIYLQADLAIKEEAIALTAPLKVKNKRFKAGDPLLHYLEGL